MPVRQVIQEGKVPVSVYTGEVEASARQQLVNLSQLPIIHHHVAAMADGVGRQHSAFSDQQEPKPAGQSNVDS